MNMLSYQVSKRKQTTPKGIAQVTEWKLPPIPWFIGELQVSGAVSTLVILLCHNWSELLGKNSCCQPPISTEKLYRFYFKIHHNSGVEEHNTSESRHLTKPTLYSGYASGKKKSKWSMQSATSILLSKIILTSVWHTNLAPTCS